VRPLFQTSTGKLMLLVIVIAVEMVLFQDVWFIVVVPPVTVMTLGRNLGLWFVLLRPRWMETRIIGMLLGSVGAHVGVSLYLLLGLTQVRKARWVQGMGPIGALLSTTAADWGASLSNQSGDLAMILRFISQRATVIEFAVLDLGSLVLIWACGNLDSHIRHRRSDTRLEGASPITPPIDDRAASPL
jgi:hypothetical protein